MAFKFQSPLVFIQSTGLTIDPNNTELFGNVSPSQTITFSIGQAVSTGSNVQFNQVTPTAEKFIIDNEDLFLKSGEISGSLTVSSNTTIAQKLTGSQDLTVLGTLTAEKIETELTQSVTLFDSGSTIFGDTSDDTHQFSGSLFSSGSLKLVTSISEISNDTSLTDSNASGIITENALRNYIDDNVDDIQSYLRKSFIHTGSFVSTSTSSFNAISASAPSGYTATSEDDFMFFINGQLMEHDALTVQQSSSYFYLKVDNDSIGYNLESDDEIVAWGKFDTSYYLEFDGTDDEVTTNYSGSADPLNKTYSFWFKSTETARNYSVFGYGSNKTGFTPNFSSGRVLMWHGANWYTYWDDTSAQDDGDWHHWMLYDDVAAITGSKLYVDGILQNVERHRTTGTLLTHSQPLTIGAYRNNSTNADHHFEGSITEFSVFSGDKTSNASTYYNNGTPYDVTNEDDLQGYWKMNEFSGSTVNDSSGEGNHGTIDGATWNYVV